MPSKADRAIYVVIFILFLFYLSSDNELSASHPNLLQAHTAMLGMENRVGNWTEAQAATGATAARQVSLDAPLLLSDPVRSSIHQREARCVASPEPICVAAVD